MTISDWLEAGQLLMLILIGWGRLVFVWDEIMGRMYP